MPIKKRHLKKDTRLTDQWNSREMGNPSGLSAWEYTPTGVKQATFVTDPIKDMIDEQFGDECDHETEFDEKCDRCHIIMHWKRLKYPTATENLLRLAVRREQRGSGR